MYDFHYNYVKTDYGERAQLLFTDTDSLAYKVNTEDFYKDISPNVEAWFDTSNYPKIHPSGIPTGKNKKVVGLFKDECGGKVMTGFVGLRAKLYAVKVGKDEHKKCKGIKKSVVKKTTTFEDYEQCVLYNKHQYRSMKTFRSRKHEIYIEEIKKVALDSRDDKRIILKDGINTLAYGHYKSIHMDY